MTDHLFQKTSREKYYKNYKSHKKTTICFLGTDMIFVYSIYWKIPVLIFKVSELLLSSCQNRDKT